MVEVTLFYYKKEKDSLYFKHFFKNSHNPYIPFAVMGIKLRKLKIQNAIDKIE